MFDFHCFRDVRRECRLLDAYTNTFAPGGRMGVKSTTMILGDP